MADGTRLNQNTTSGDIIATDEITDGGVADGEKVQRVKLGFGADGFYVDIDPAHALPIVWAGSPTITATISGTPAVTISGTPSVTVSALDVALSTRASDASVIAITDFLLSCSEGDRPLYTHDLYTGWAFARPGEDPDSVTAGMFLGGGVDAGGLARRFAIAAGGGLSVEGVAGGVPVPVSGTVEVATLPATAATAAAQATGNTSLASILSGLAALATATAQAAAQVTLTAIRDRLPSSLGAQVAGSSLSVVPATTTTFPVSLASLPALPAGTNTIGSVRIALASVDKQSTLAVGGKVLTPSGTALYFYVKNSSGGAIFIQIFDSSTTPNTGDRPNAYTVSVANGAAGNGAFGQNIYGAPCPNGVLLIASSTQDTYTPIASTNVPYVVTFLPA